jgi:hypothetical protein
MKQIVSGLTALLIAMALGGQAQAGPASTALAKCLVDSSTGKDHVVFMQWFFAALSVNPSVQSFAATTKDQRNDAARGAAAVFDRLVLVDCRKEAVAAEREDGNASLSTGFEAFGRIAVTELMADPNVTKEMSALGDYLDKPKWTALAAEIGKK